MKPIRLVRGPAYESRWPDAHRGDANRYRTPLQLCTVGFRVRVHAGGEALWTPYPFSPENRAVVRPTIIRMPRTRIDVLQNMDIPEGGE